LAHEVEAGASAILVAEEALAGETERLLAALRGREPAWSDLPMFVVTRPGANSATATAALDSLGNVTLLERPVRVSTLVSAVRVALRARERQYALRDRFEAQSLLAAIVASSDDAIISKTIDGTILSWNEGAQRIFGYTPAEAIGQPIFLIIPPDRHDEERMILSRLVRGEHIDHFETVRVSKDGRPIDLSVTISPIRDGANRIIGASKVARDISERKRAETALRQNIEALERAESALREADRRKDEFLATLAHELRNPLAPIRNSLDILRLSGNSNATLGQVLEMMERQVNHMVRLVDDLMEISRITRGKIEFRRERVELAGVIRSAVETSQPLINAGGHHLSVTIPPESLTLDADAVRLAQVFANLLNNAAKYSDPGGRIGLTVRRENDSVLVSVKDNGIGISREMLPRVFEMFTQASTGHAGSHGGLGIGLTLVRSLVEMHGGRVTASSEGPGKGSEFVVRLPLAVGPALDVARPRTSTHAQTIPIRVLVVDDNRDGADSLGDLLERLGTEVQVVHDGPAALEALGRFKPSMVLMDIGMPEMSGYEVARRIRAMPEHRELMLVALTGWGQEEDRRRSRQAGFDFHLTKPTHMFALQDLMASLNERQEGREHEPRA
jgi:PAS domain S-box-containing protein